GVLHAGAPLLRRLSIRRDKLQGPARRGDSGCGSFHRRKQRRAARSLVTVEVPPRHHHYEMAGRVAYGNLPWTADENPDLPLGYYHHRALRHGRHHLVEEAGISARSSRKAKVGFHPLDYSNLEQCKLLSLRALRRRSESD